jgi:hypothetical protein
MALQVAWAAMRYWQHSPSLSITQAARYGPVVVVVVVVVRLML